MTIDLSALGDRVPAPLLELAARRGRLVRIPARRVVFNAGDPVAGVHLVVDGNVCVTRTADGRAVTVHHESAGGLLGEVGLFSDGTYPNTAVSTEPTVLCLIPAEEVRRVIETDPALAGLFLHRMALRARGVMARLDRIAHLTVLQRLVLYLLERHATARAGAMSLGMTLTALAEELGTVKEIVVRELRTLRKLGAIEAVGAGRYRVVDAAMLRTLAGRRARDR